MRNPLRILLVLILGVAATVLLAVAGSIRRPVSSKWCTIGLFIVFIVPLRRQAGTCSATRLDSHLVVCPMCRVLREHVKWYNTNFWDACGSTSLGYWTIRCLVFDTTHKCATWKFLSMALNKWFSNKPKSLSPSSRTIICASFFFDNCLVHW